MLFRPAVETRRTWRLPRKILVTIVRRHKMEGRVYGGRGRLRLERLPWSLAPSLRAIWSVDILLLDPRKSG
jgi:hypothetical protein